MIDFEEHRRRQQAQWREQQRRRTERINTELRVLRSRRAALIKVTPDTNPIYWEASDGWHGAYLHWRVGPCTDYTAATQALCEAMTVTAWDIAMAHQDGAA